MCWARGDTCLTVHCDPAEGLLVSENSKAARKKKKNAVASESDSLDPRRDASLPKYVNRDNSLNLWDKVRDEPGSK